MPEIESAGPQLEKKLLLRALRAFRKGDFTARLPLDLTGIDGEIAEAFNDVVELSAEQVRPAPEFNGSVDASYITGLGSLKTGVRERMLILTDIEQLMSSPEMGLVGLDLQRH